MPAGNMKWPPRMGTYSPYTLANAERDHYLVAVRCGGCKKTVYYLPGDLAKVYGADRAAKDPPPFDCPRCGTGEMLRVSLRAIEEGDWGSLPVTRPGPVRQIQTWRRVKLGDEI